MCTMENLQRSEPVMAGAVEQVGNANRRGNPAHFDPRKQGVIVDDCVREKPLVDRHAAAHVERGSVVQSLRDADAGEEQIVLAGSQK